MDEPLTRTDQNLILDDQDTMRNDPLDWSVIRDRIDLARVATALLGPAPGRRGERGRRLWWHCPLGGHEDPNPSFAIDPGRPQWHCFGCSEHGDAIDLARRLNPGWSFGDAATWLAEQAGIDWHNMTPSGRPSPRPRPPAARMPAKAPQRPPEQP